MCVPLCLLSSPFPDSELRGLRQAESHLSSTQTVAPRPSLDGGFGARRSLPRAGFGAGLGGTAPLAYPHVGQRTSATSISVRLPAAQNIDSDLARSQERRRHDIYGRDH